MKRKHDITLAGFHRPDKGIANCYNYNIQVFTDIPSPVMSIARDTKSRRFRIQMDKCISPEVFRPFLEFLYTGIDCFEFDNI